MVGFENLNKCIVFMIYFINDCGFLDIVICVFLNIKVEVLVIDILVEENSVMVFYWILVISGIIVNKDWYDKID